MFFNIPDIQGRLWLGPHLNIQGSADATYWIEHGKPSVVKLLETDPPGEFDQRPDWTLWIGRKYENDFDPNAPTRGGFSENPFVAAAQYVERFLAQAIVGKPQIRCWELNNEPVITTTERMMWYANFLAEGARILRETYNVTAVIGNWSVGHPLVELNLWPHYVPALEAARRYGAILGRHSYGPLNDYYALRHRRDNESFAALGYPHLPVVVTECGADNVSSPEGPNAPWKIYYNGDEGAYGNYLIQLEAALREDAAYCLGGTVFTYGFGWEPFNLNDRSIGHRLGDLGGSLPLRPIFSDPLPHPVYTHRVKAVALNVRAHPWTGVVMPYITRVLTQGMGINVFGFYRPGVASGWACINASGNEWVSERYIEPW